MYPAGFEPAHPKITELKSVALDHSAMDTINSFSLVQDVRNAGARTLDLGVTNVVINHLDISKDISTALCRLSYTS